MGCYCGPALVAERRDLVRLQASLPMRDGFLTKVAAIQGKMGSSSMCVGPAVTSPPNHQSSGSPSAVPCPLQQVAYIHGHAPRVDGGCEECLGVRVGKLTCGPRRLLPLMPL
uniref:Uncharacterized protein n=1 Tax=Leersia perrieri TaxID=77586 RepID=A0A0D9XUJ3_9ORYZ